MANWPGDDAVFPLCVPLIKQFEGFRAAPYKDSAGIATIGYGTILYPPPPQGTGKAVAMTDAPCTEDQATGYLSYQMSLKSKQIAPLLKKPATLHQAAAMLSLTYNIGTAAFQSSTVLRKFNGGDISGAADAFLMWDKATVNGQHVVVPGLLNRRQAERTIFLTADA
jgi:lysozyme